MSIERQGNWLSQQRVDVPHVRALESSVAYDFDQLAGLGLAGGGSYVIKGLTIPVTGIGGQPEALVLVTAGAVVLHYRGAEAGTIFTVPETQPNEVLSAVTNAKVIGSFAEGRNNYVSLDLRRASDTTTKDIVKFLDPDTRQETSKVVPLAKTLGYVINVSTQPFSAAPNLLPIAIVHTVVGTNAVDSITDARPMFFRLGTGGDSPDATAAYTYAQQTEDPITATLSNDPDPFASGDKSLASLKDWMNAAMTRFWDIGGGRRWNAPTTDRDVKIGFTGSVMLSIDGYPAPANGKNFYLDSGADTLYWAGVKAVFANASVTYNAIADSGVLGLAGFSDGKCLYIDINRDDVSPISPQLGDLLTVGQSSPPGQRWILAWRVGTDIYWRDYASGSGTVTAPVATLTSFGTVRLYNNDDEAFSGATPEAVSTWSLGKSYRVPQLKDMGAPATASSLLRGGTYASPGTRETVGVDGDWGISGNVWVDGNILKLSAGVQSLGTSGSHWPLIHVDTFSVYSGVTTDIVPTVTGTKTIGGLTNHWLAGYFDNLDIGDGAGGSIILRPNLKISGDLIPNAPDARDIGDGTNYWRVLHTKAITGYSTGDKLNVTTNLAMIGASNNNISWNTARVKTIWTQPNVLSSSGITTGANTGVISILDAGGNYATFQVPQPPAGASLVKIHIFGYLSGNGATVTGDGLDIKLYRHYSDGGSPNISSTFDYDEYKIAAGATVGALLGGDVSLFYSNLDLTYTFSSGSQFSSESRVDSMITLALNTPFVVPSIMQYNSAGVRGFTVRIQASTISSHVTFVVNQIGIEYTYDSVDNA